ncbi:MAG: LPP20 family lipoprotein [Rhodocyclaceae bacterium]|nr:LPP20 family lipoprotein [Rhodocyclaceae bacterium]
MAQRSVLRLSTSLLAASFVLLSGCVTHPCCNNPHVVPLAPQSGVSCVNGVNCAVQGAVLPAKLQAVGYGAPGSYSQYTHGQQKLMAIRAAQVDAYRNLAEQVYGFRVWGSTSVSAFATQNDTVRTYVDAFIRGARVVNTTAIADGNFEVTVELELSQNFLNCFNASGFCGSNYAAPTCGTQGCTSPSAIYYNN